jgi:hypothetical protein
MTTKFVIIRPTQLAGHAARQLFGAFGLNFGSRLTSVAINTLTLTRTVIANPHGRFIEAGVT